MTSRAEKNRQPFIIENRTPKLAKRNRRMRKPLDPAEIARRLAEVRRNPELWGPNEDALKLVANADVQDTASTRDKVRRVQRFDCFHVFHARGELPQHALAAVRRLSDDIAVLHRTSGAQGTGPKVQNSTKTTGLSHSQILAGQRISDVSGMTGAHSWAILQALIERPAIMGDNLNNWRAVVQDLTGEHNHMAQGALVKAAAMNLAGAYSAIDQGERRAG